MLNLRIVSPEEIAYNGEAESVKVPGKIEDLNREILPSFLDNSEEDIKIYPNLIQTKKNIVFNFSPKINHYKEIIISNDLV